MTRFSSRLAAVAAALAVLAPAAFADTGKLVVSFSGLKEAKGAVLIALYDEAGFNGGKALSAGEAAVSGDQASFVFDGLAPGRYGLKVFHDVDGDGKMGTNPFGMPTEPYAFSNNAKASFGPATWAQAGFDLTAGETVQAIRFD